MRIMKLFYEYTLLIKGLVHAKVSLFYLIYLIGCQGI